LGKKVAAEAAYVIPKLSFFAFLPVKRERGCLAFVLNAVVVDVRGNGIF
jgi:hypothetical protein